MTIRANKFTPEVLLGAPRRSEGIPNSNGFQVLYSTSTYSFDEHAKTSEIRVLDVNSGETSLITDKQGASEPQWLDDETVLLLIEDDDGTSVTVGPVKDFGNRCVYHVFWTQVIIATWHAHSYVRHEVRLLLIPVRFQFVKTDRFAVAMLLATSKAQLAMSKPCPSPTVFSELP